MYYSAIGILAALVLLIINHDVLFVAHNEDAPRARSAYQKFLLSVIAFLVADSFWGVWEKHHLIGLLYVDTMLYFVAMAISVVLWTRYVVAYLENKSAVFIRSGYVFLALMAVVLVINLFEPIMFWIDENGVYHAGLARYVLFVFQVVMFLLASIYSFVGGTKAKASLKRRYLTICLFGIEMTVAVGAQVAFPLWPFYTMGCLLGTCLLHAFVMEDEKDEHARLLEEHINRERLQEQELGSTRRLAFTDSLTGVRSTHSYVDVIRHVDQRIAEGEMGKLAVAVFDVNDLKVVNDTKGHEAGDSLLIEAAQFICASFEGSEVYRIGGDEFVAILEGADYESRAALEEQFKRQSVENLHNGMVVVALGMAEFDPMHDNDFEAVFKRADAKMYVNKHALKSLKGSL